MSSGRASCSPRRIGIPFHSKHFPGIIGGFIFILRLSQHHLALGVTRLASEPVALR